MELKIVKNICPHCEKTLYVNKKTFANHVRWCKKNPKYETILQSTKEKLTSKKATKKEHEVKCEYCGNQYIIKCTDSEFKNGRYRKTCSDLCAKRLTNLKAGKKRIRKISETIRKNYHLNDENYDVEEMVYINECKFCGKKFKTKKRKQQFCSRKCSMKNRNKIFLMNADKFKLYKHQCQFTFSLNYYPNEFEFNLINENGWYKPKNHGNNLNGVSRDHMFSIKKGFENKIDPYLLSHPANCKLLVQSKNASKHSKCSIDINELKNKIKHFEEKYGHYENKIDYTGIEDFNNH